MVILVRNKEEARGLDEPSITDVMEPFAEWNINASFAAQPCESEQQHAVILVRNKGLPPLDQGNMW